MGATDDFVLHATERDAFELDGRLYSVVEHGNGRPSIQTVVGPHQRKGVYVQTYLRDIAADWPTYRRVHAKYEKRRAARAKLAHLTGLIGMLEAERDAVRLSLER